MANRRRRLAPYLFISPFFIGYAIFFLYPVLWALYLSFFQQVGIGSEPKFVGLQNYANLLSDDTFRTALVNTSYYAAGSIFLIVPLALLLAVVLFMRSLRGRGLKGTHERPPTARRRASCGNPSCAEEPARCISGPRKPWRRS